MNKLKTLLVAIVFVLLTIASNQVLAAEDDWEKTFLDDFSSYDLGKVEDNQDFKDVWTNDLWSGTNDTATDINDVATIKQEGDNKFLNLNYNGSFFYTSPHNFRAKNFEVSFKMRSHDLTDTWVGVNMRKEYRDTRFNGGTGMMLYFRTNYIKGQSENIIGEMLQVQALRGGSLSATDLTSEMVDANGNTGADANFAIKYMYPEGEIDSTQQIEDNWYDIKVVVSDTGEKNEASYTVYINDELMATLTYARNSLNIYGYFSLTACMTDIDVDDFSIQSNDTVSPPPIVRVNKLVPQTSKMNEKMILPGAETGDIELIGDADNKVEITIFQPDGTEVTLPADVYEFTPTQDGIYTITYIAKSSLGVEGKAEFMVNVENNDVPDSTTTTTEDNNVPVDDNNDNSNTTPIIIVVSAVVLVGAIGGFFFLRKK